ncbi:YhzD family protein [Halalkalibacterium ligniniphilum]|uniref:YhzD family protein n=1 Tax=Halalkalibacterium ligniniphilum TaxID=1134413 RepID=UPI0003475300|nr:YhzD family protein [Halalkalibacterium ligniniphilum]
MLEYVITVFEPSGEKVFEERFEASNDTEAKTLGQQKLAANNYEEHTHRMTRSGKLLLFHR